MPVLTRPTASTHALTGAQFTSLATPSSGSLDTAIWEVRLAPGHEGAPHRLTRQEVFVVLSGEGVATLDGEPHAVGAGSVIVVPVATPFSLAAEGSEELVALCCLPVGGQAVVDGAEPFTPPWAE